MSPKSTASRVPAAAALLAASALAAALAPPAHAASASAHTALPPAHAALPLEYAAPAYALPPHAVLALAAPADRGTLPNLVGRTASSARHAALAEGFTEPHTYDALGLGRNQIMRRNWKVCTQDPLPGEAERTAEITLGVVRVEEQCPGATPETRVPASRLMPDLKGKPLSAVYQKVGYRSSIHATDVSGQNRIVLFMKGWRVCSHRPAPGEVYAGRPVEVDVVQPPETCP
ncbi:hypothetical protein AB0C51_09255 [Streptomyces pathocidini]|uniref:hypothetical protein n=1 Tax=Streptomyces pathocidini TaxID=1650571 RepID=UPI00340CEC51